MSTPMRLPVTVSLRELFPSSSFVGCADIRVAEATDRSDSCTPGCLFAASRGSRQDGMQFVEEAIRCGAAALLVRHPLPSAAVAQCVVTDVRKAYAKLCAAMAGHPAGRLKIAGVTGTNGKTTVSWLLRSILQAAGLEVGLLGTIEYDDGGHTQQAELTTPDAHTLAAWLAAMVGRGTTHAVLELSSHALDQDRAAGLGLDVAVLTNLTQDHFDYHGDLARYARAKARILDLCLPGAAIVWNAHDAAVADIVANSAQPGDDTLETISFGINTGINTGPDTAADVTARVLEESRRGSRFLVGFADGEELEVSTSLVGRPNMLNCLAAASAARRMDVSLEEIARGIAALAGVPGRLEAVQCGQPFDVFVDYAHTDDALRRAIAQLKRLTAGRVICVFGAGGDRDRTKRPLLGAAGATADLVIVTSDNPRSENPSRIIREVAAGTLEAGAEPIIVVDRADAIQSAIASAGPGDCVLVAGKGHERFQQVGERRLRFDDREVVREALRGSVTSERVGA